MPGRPQITSDGRAKVNHHGKVEYVSMLEWATRESRERFSEAVFREVLAQHPDAIPS
jgi:hypothetical protein